MSAEAGGKGEGEPPRRAAVPSGRIRLHGHFCGVVTTASHCMDVELPVEHEVAMEALEPVLHAFLQDAVKAEAAGHGPQEAAEGPAKGGGGPAGGRARPAALWQDLLKLLAVDSHGKESRAREILKAAGGTKQGKVASPDPRLARIEEQEAALEVDYEAKEALLEAVIQERDKLREQLQALQETPTTPLGKLATGLLRQGTGLLAEGMHEVGHLMGLDRGGSHAENLDEEVVKLSSTEAEHLVRKGSFLLGGHYAGTLCTTTHMLEVALPLEGLVPGAPVLEILRALASNNGGCGGNAHKAGAEAESGHGHGHVTPDVWAKLIKLLSVEVPKEEKAEEEQRALAEGLQKEVQRLKASLDEATKELEGMQIENSKIQMEAMQLKSRNTTLSGYLVSAESSAQKLRSTLGQAGVTAMPALESGGSFQSSPAEASLALPDLDGPSRGRALAPRSQAGQEPSLSALTSRLTAAASGHRTAPSWEPPPLPPHRYGASQFSPYVMTPPQLSTPQRYKTPSSESTPPQRRPELDPRLHISDAALVADLKELERWAHELRTLKAA